MPLTSTNGKDLFVVSSRGAVEATKDDKITFLCIHGLGSTHAFYYSLLPELASSSYECVVYDTYGSGQSKYNGGDQSVKTMAADVEALMKDLALEGSRTIIVGHSMGGMVACEVASRVRVRGLVLLGPVHPSPAMGDVFTQRIDSVMKNGMEALADAVPASAPGAKATGLQRAFIRALIMSQDPKGYASLCKVIADAEAPDYSAVQSPVLILAGAEDKTTPMSSSETILKSLGTAPSQKRIEVLDGVGHWHCIEAGPEVGQHLVKFAKSIE